MQPANLQPTPAQWHQMKLREQSHRKRRRLLQVPLHRSAVRALAVLHPLMLKVADSQQMLKLSRARVGMI